MPEESIYFSLIISQWTGLVHTIYWYVPKLFLSLEILFRFTSSLKDWYFDLRLVLAKNASEVIFASWLRENLGTHFEIRMSSQQNASVFAEINNLENSWNDFLEVR